MSLSPYNPYDRYRQRSMQRMGSMIFVMLLMFISGLIGFWIGGAAAVHSEEVLRQNNITLKEQIEEMQLVITELRAETQTANARFEQLQKTYEETIPPGPMRDLTTLIREQLEEGMDPKRLEFAVRSARPPRNCTDPETKRFVVSTPAYKGADSEITIAEGSIRITGSGESAKTDKGDPEAWYDPSKTVALVFTMRDGSTEKKRGILPLQQTIVLENKQYRFSIEEGARSFAKVSFDSCDYP